MKNKKKILGSMLGITVGVFVLFFFFWLPSGSPPNSDLSRVLLRAHAWAYDKHLHDGGKEIVDYRDFDLLNATLASSEWVESHQYLKGHGGVIEKIGPLHVDEFGNRIWFHEEDGIVYVRSSGLDEVQCTTDDLKFPWGQKSSTHRSKTRVSGTVSETDTIKTESKSSE